MSELVGVGDVIVTKHGLGGVKRYPITRVTKTLAKSKREDGRERTFKRVISSNMAHPYEKWNSTSYSVDKLKVSDNE